ncbi:hypothetical protein LRS13_20395 [Svornostia abyssi]|uniref:Uncharacterized protein n=1 Tax=Svornostia abyssi TaxID=2898438 RepID=A0ABY5PEL1_9ACTN|nr:hypothetical protein LRS13_20395 [Parviterribacteraceae bacterium J379]
MFVTARRTAALGFAMLVALAAPAHAQTSERISGFKVSGSTFEQWFEPALSDELQGFRYACAARDPKLSYRVERTTATIYTNYLFAAQDWKSKKFGIGQYLPVLDASRPSITLSEIIKESLAANGPMPRNEGFGLLGTASGYWVLVNYNRPLPIGPYRSAVERLGLFTYRGLTKEQGSCQAAGLPTYLVNADLATM